MGTNSILDQAKFWKVIKFLTSKTDKAKLSEICDELNIVDWELNSYLNFLAEIGYPFLVKDKTFIPPSEKPELKLEFTLLEWMQFQAHFPKISECTGKPFHEDFKEKLVEIEDEYKSFDLFEPMLTLENVLKEHQPSLLESVNSPNKEVLVFLEESIIEKLIISLKLAEEHIKVLPRKIVFFDGCLNLIAEDVSDRSLLNISLKQIQHCYEESDFNYSHQFSKLEIDDFISSLRKMSDNQIRLVLKVFSRDQFSLNFNQMYFDNPCLFTNPDGDFIWAATLEPNEKVFEWLCELGPAVEILDPTSFKLEFIKYCEHKLKKLA